MSSDLQRSRDSDDVQPPEVEVLDQSVTAIPAEDWDAFETWIRRPAQAIPVLAELARRAPSWER